MVFWWVEILYATPNTTKNGPQKSHDGLLVGKHDKKTCTLCCIVRLILYQVHQTTNEADVTVGITGFSC